MSNQAVEAAISAGASKVTYGGAGTVGIGWLLSNEATVLAGLLIAVAGFAVNWYYRAKQDRRAEAEHKAHMKQLATKPGDLS